MTKKLNITSITNELEESAFFPSKKPQAEVKSLAAPLPTPANTQPLDSISQPAEVNQPIPERPNGRTVVRPNGKRIITRNSFEIYEDQMDTLRNLSFKEKMDGKLGSMSQMVREAIDSYLQTRFSEK